MNESSKLTDKDPALGQGLDRERSARVRRTLRKEDVLRRPGTAHKAKVVSVFVKHAEELWDNVPI